MSKKLESLTPEQSERMESFAQEWIERGWRTRPLTDDEWKVWEAGTKRCYEYAKIPWPGVVIRVPNPLVGAFAAPIADITISRLRVDGAVGGAVRGAVDGAVGDAVDDAVGDAVGGAVRGAVDDAVGGAVHGAVHGAVGGAVRGAVDDAVRGAVDDAVDGAVGDAVGDAVRGAVGGAVDGAVGGAVDDAVGGAVHGAVDDAVRGAVDGAVRTHILKIWYYRFGGRLWPWWQSYIAFFRDVCELQLDGDIWDRSHAYQDGQSAGWWWPFRDFVMVCDVPTVICLEQVGPTGWGSHRLHCEDGPAVAWPGYELHFWHGTEVPADLITKGWDAERILTEKNAEIRRCAIERTGWPEFIRAAGLKQVGESVPDPGNPGHDLRLFDVPRKIYAADVRVLICDNASPERDGTRRSFGLTVPASIPDPLAAASWTFGMNPGDYALCEVRT